MKSLLQLISLTDKMESPGETIRYLRKGDRIEVTTEGCSENLQDGDNSLPPPSVGYVNISTTNVTNEFRINFINWGDTDTINNTKFKYSAVMFKGNLYTELCDGDDNDINELGLLCNSNNNKRLGFFNSNGTYPLRARVRYYNSNINGTWAELSTTIDITSISTSESTITVISSKLEPKNMSELVNSLNFRKQALDELIQPLAKPPRVSTCPDNYCEHGTCSISQDRPRCKCDSSYSGSTCQISTETLQLAVKQNEQAASSLASLASTSDADTVLNVVSIIISNTDVVSLIAIKDIVKSLDIIFSANSGPGKYIDYHLLNVVRTNLMSAMVKEIVLSKGTSTRFLGDTNSTSSNDTESIDQLGKLNSVFRNYINANYEIILLNENATIEDIEGQMNTYYFPASLGNVSVDGVTVNSKTENSIVSAMLYPLEVSKLFPTPSKSSTIGSNILSVSTQSSGSADSVKSKKIAVFKFVSIARRLVDTSSIPTCGYYDESSLSFSSVGCTTLTDSSNNVECNCDTMYSNIYVVYGDGKKMSKTILIIVIVVPIAVSIIIAIAVTTYCCLKKKEVKIKSSNVKALDSSQVSMVPTVN